MDLIISTQGLLRLIYGEAIDLAAMGQVNIQRASFVEPAPHGGWQVDLTPVGGPVVAGFPTRSRALAYELDWLQQHWLLVPPDDRSS